MNDPSRVNAATSMSFSPTTSGGSPALIDVASEVTSSLIEVSVSLTWRFLWVALNSLTSFCARVLETVRAQNWTVPVALTPKVLTTGGRRRALIRMTRSGGGGQQHDGRRPGECLSSSRASLPWPVLVM